MSHKTIALILGGLLPAVLLGLSGVAQKWGATSGIGIGPFLFITGLVTLIVGGIFVVVEQDWSIEWTSSIATMLFGLFWATATGCIALALKKYGGQLSQLVPIYNMNTLVAVFIGMLVFSEWQHVNPIRATLATLLIVIGGTLASRS